MKWTLEQIAAPNSTAFMKAEFGGIEKIETPDARTVKIVMKEPTATLPIWLASPHMPIIAKDSIEGRAGLGVGAGPFMIKDAGARRLYRGREIRQVLQARPAETRWHQARPPMPTRTCASPRSRPAIST